MDKIIQVDGRALKLRASASVPRLYRIKFGRDILSDMAQLQKHFDRAVRARHIAPDTPQEKRDKLEQEARLSVLDLTVFENVAYIMARHADPDNVPGSVEEWLDGFNTFSIYEILPEILSLWGMNTQAVITPKNA